MRRIASSIAVAVAIVSVLAPTNAGAQTAITPSLLPQTFPEAIGVEDPLRSTIAAGADAEQDDIILIDPSASAAAADGTIAEDGTAAQGLRTRVIGAEPDNGDARQPPRAAAPEEDSAPGLEFVTDRQRAELEALGLRAGSFILLPEVVTAVETTDNVFSADVSARSDVLYVTRPTLQARSDWARHELVIDYAGEYGVYDRFESENPEETALGISGRLDVTQLTALSGRAFFATEQESRGDIESPAGAAEPILRTSYGFSGEVSHRISRATASLRGGVEFEDYGDSVDITGAAIDSSDRDQTETALGTRLAYDVSEVTQVFIDGEYLWRRHDQAIDDSGFARDADRQTLLVGARLEPVPLIRTEITVGYVHESPADPRLADIDDIVLGASLDWAVTPLTTVSAGYQTEIDSTTVAGASAALTRTASIGVDHELLRHFVVGASLEHEEVDYRGVDLAEETLTTTVDGEYWVTRWAAVLAAYQHIDESAAGGSGAIEENVFSIGLKLRP